MIDQFLSECTNCKTSVYLVERRESGDIVCTQCGFVRDERIISDTKDWSNYADDTKDNSRVGYIDHSNPFATLRTFIESSPKSRFLTLNKEGKEVTRDLARLHLMISSNSKETAFNQVGHMFTSLKYTHELSNSTITTAKCIWGEIAKSNDVWKGRNREGIIAACVYLACENTTPRMPDEVAKMMGVDFKTLLDGEAILRNRLESLGSLSKYTNKVKHVENQQTHNRETQMIVVYIEKLNLDYKQYGRLCQDIFQKCEEDLKDNIELKSAYAGIISFAVHVYYKKKIPRKVDILKTVGITNPTLTNAVRVLKASIQRQNLTEYLVF
jgi:transcription initiation factor TFIIIB Brf1 subunit/transcription initiation factor TFIIB